MTVIERLRNHDTDYVLTQFIRGTPDLVHLRCDIRAFLTTFEDLMVAETVLVAVMLAGDAFRYGQPPVVLRLRLVADGACLRLEVADHGPARSDPRPHGYRGGLLDRISSRRGLEQAGDGTTTIWAEIPVGPSRLIAP